MKIICDAFGGDNAPLEIVKGCADAVSELNIEILLTGKKTEIEKISAENGISLKGIEIIDAPEVISMCDEPGEILKSKKDCSMAEGLRRLAAGDGDAFVSAGSTGALLIGSTFIVKRAKGVKRCALAPLMPNINGMHLLIDCGANVECRPEMLAQFAVMGSVYMEKVMGVANPRVGLANNGTEESKGGELQVETHKLLKETPGINFIGNVEARDIPAGVCDVLVADGFTGNIILKLTEGVAAMIMKMIKQVFLTNTRTKIAGKLVNPSLGGLKKMMSTEEYGGAPIIGASKPVFKAHGNSNAYAFKSAIKQSVQFAQTGAAEIINEALA